MPTALIAEDEPMLLAQLKARLVEAWPRWASWPRPGARKRWLLARLHRPDIAFLDIRMPVKSGLDVARELDGECHVVFVTAYDEYAVAAFEEGAVDYVLKPVAAERGESGRRLKARLASARRWIWGRCWPSWPRGAGRSLKWCGRRSALRLRVIAVDDVVYFQAEDKYTKVVTADGEALIRKTIKELYEELDPDAFWQVHRGTIVNLRAIARVERDWRDQPVIVLK